MGRRCLVNALARESVERLVLDRATAVDVDAIDEAKERLIARQDTHLDSLVERLRDRRVRRVIEPIIAGALPDEVAADDVRYVMELGLVRRDPETGALALSNPIYQQVVPRALAGATEVWLPPLKPIWQASDGRLDEKALLDAFLAFWRRHGEPLMKSAPYHEIAPHLVLMAFLQRVVNGGGVVEREYAIGSGRLDLCVRYRGATLPIELKVWRPDSPDPRDEGLEQLDAYLSSLGAEHGWLVIFDRRPDAPPVAERTTTESARTPGGRDVVVIRA